MTPPPIQFDDSRKDAHPVFAVDVQVVHADGTSRPLTRADVEAAYTTGVPLRASCMCHGVVQEGVVTPRGSFAKSWRPPLAWGNRLKSVPLMTLDGKDYTAAYRPSIAVVIGGSSRVHTDFGVLEGDAYPEGRKGAKVEYAAAPGHPHTPGNYGLDEVMRDARRKVNKGVRYALVKGNMDTYLEDGELTRNTVMLVVDAALPEAELKALRSVLEAVLNARIKRMTAKFGGQAPRLPPEKQEEHDAAAAAAAVSVAPAFGSLALGGGDDESPVL